MQRMQEEKNRKQKEDYSKRIAQIKEERRLSALEELTYEEEAAMEVEAIALQGHLLGSRNRKKGRRRATVASGGSK